MVEAVSPFPLAASVFHGLTRTSTLGELARRIHRFGDLLMIGDASRRDTALVEAEQFMRVLGISDAARILELLLQGQHFADPARSIADTFDTLTGPCTCPSYSLHGEPLSRFPLKWLSVAQVAKYAGREPLDVMRAASNGELEAARVPGGQGLRFAPVWVD